MVMFRGEGPGLTRIETALFRFGSIAINEATSSTVRRFATVGVASRGSSLLPVSNSVVVVACRIHSNNRVQNV